MLSAARHWATRTAADVDFVWHGSLAEEAQWEANSLNYTQIQRTQLGSKAQDLLTKEASSTIGGRDLTVSNHARQGRLDGLSMKYYGMSFTKEIGPYKSGNQSVFTRYGSDGTPMASNLEYMVAENAGIQPEPAGWVLHRQSFCADRLLSGGAVTRRGAPITPPAIEVFFSHGDQRFHRR